MIRIVPGRRRRSQFTCRQRLAARRVNHPDTEAAQQEKPQPDGTPASRREHRSPHHGSAQDGVGNDKAAAIKPSRPSPDVTAREGPSRALRRGTRRIADSARLSVLVLGTGLERRLTRSGLCSAARRPRSKGFRCCGAGALARLAAHHSVGAVSGKPAGGHDLIKPALANNPGELERTRGVIWHGCAGLRAAIGVQWSPKRWRARRPRGARQNLNSSQKGTVVQAITVRDRAAGAAGLTLSDIPHPTRPKTT